MIEYRPFRNSDPPALAEIWRSQKPTRSLAQSVTPAILDRMVLSKPYFDREGIIVAEDDGTPVAFVHAGFGSNAFGTDLDNEVGVIAMLLVAPHDQRDAIARELLNRAEQYLVARGSIVVFAGGFARKADPYYIGLSGGCSIAGVMESNSQLADWYRQWGVEQHSRFIVLQRSLAGFRAPMNRQMMQVRRRFQVEAQLDPPPTCWWEACTVGLENRTRFRIALRGGGPPCGETTLWDMEPMASSWGIHACGLLDLRVEESMQRTGIGTFLAGEALRQMQSHGATLAECHIDERNTPALGLLAKLGFEQVDVGVVYQRTRSV